MNKIKKIPWTIWYLPLYGLSVWLPDMLGIRMPGEADIYLPLPNEHEFAISFDMIFFIIGAIVLSVEVKRAITFNEKGNNIDAIFSIIIGVVYLFLFVLVESFQHQNFFFYVFLTLIDSFLGLLIILGISRRDFGVNRGDS